MGKKENPTEDELERIERTLKEWVEKLKEMEFKYEKKGDD